MASAWKPVYYQIAQKMSAAIEITAIMVDQDLKSCAGCRLVGWLGSERRQGLTGASRLYTTPEELAN